MTASVYVLCVPLGLIAVASFVVRQQDQSFQSGKRAANIQNSIPLMRGTGAQAKSAEHFPAQRLNHARYGVNESAGGGNMLGRDDAPRQLGERSREAPDWLSVQQPNALKKSPLPDIAGFIDSPPPRDPLSDHIASESGYQITSDEVTRLDMETGRVVFNRNVHMVSPQFNLTCNQLVIHLGKDKNSMELAEAHGSVNILLTGVPPEKAYRGQSNDAIFHPLKSQIVLTGWPKAKGMNQEQVSAEATTRMTLFTKTGRLLTEGRAQTRVTKSFMSESTGAKKLKTPE